MRYRHHSKPRDACFRAKWPCPITDKWMKPAVPRWLCTICSVRNGFLGGASRGSGRATLPHYLAAWGRRAVGCPSFTSASL